MPVDYRMKEGEVLYQRDQYEKGGPGRWYWDYRDEVTISHINHEQRILDIGCGEGITLERLIRRLPDRHIIGLDLLAENVAICKNHGLPVVQGDAYHLAFADGSLDCCLFMEVIEHLDQPERALAEIHRVLKTGGLLLIVFPNDLMWVVARLATLKIKEAFYDPGHVRRWSPRSIRDEVVEHSFEVIKQTSLPFRCWPLSLHHLAAVRKI
jgi:SAM-dependent methyltransferase